jgi:hypothetical protein
MKLIKGESRARMKANGDTVASASSVVVLLKRGLQSSGIA